MNFRLIALPLLFALASPATAGEVFTGLHRHAVKTPLSLSASEERGLDLSLGYRWSGIGRTAIQPYAFTAFNSAGDTSYAAAGLSFRLGRKFYTRPGLGLALHTGSKANFNRPGNGEIEFGSRILFEPEVALGVQASDHLAIEASWVHLSHATLFGRQNPGIDNIGLRLNWTL